MGNRRGPPIPASLSVGRGMLSHGADKLPSLALTATVLTTVIKEANHPTVQRFLREFYNYNGGNSTIYGLHLQNSMLGEDLKSVIHNPIGEECGVLGNDDSKYGLWRAELPISLEALGTYGYITEESMKNDEFATSVMNLTGLRNPLELNKVAHAVSDLISFLSGKQSVKQKKYSVGELNRDYCSVVDSRSVVAQSKMSTSEVKGMQLGRDGGSSFVIKLAPQYDWYFRTINY